MSQLSQKNYLISVVMREDYQRNYSLYPFNLPIVSNLNKPIMFNKSVTFITGENGSGKSTFLEAIAISLGFNPEGGSKNFTFESRSSHSLLYKHLRLSKSSKRLKTGYFFRAESFYNLASEIDSLDSIEAGGGKIIDAYGGKSLHEQSHGESFMALFKNRFFSQGLYLLDEPESALSGTSEMAMLSLINELSKNGAQFIISTHSPILLSYPNSTIFEARENGLEEVPYECTDSYIINKQFLNNHIKILKELLD